MYAYFSFRRRLLVSLLACLLISNIGEYGLILKENNKAIFFIDCYFNGQQKCLDKFILQANDFNPIWVAKLAQKKDREKLVDIVLKSNSIIEDPFSLSFQGDRQYAEGNYSRAIDYWEAADNLDRLWYLGKKMEANGDLTTAHDAYQAILKLNPGDKSVDLAIASVLIEAKDYDAAVPFLKAAIEKAPENHWAYLLQANNFRALGDYSRALELYANVQSEFPEFKHVHIEIAWTYFLKGDYELAYQLALKDKARRDDFNKFQLLRLAIIFEQAGDFDNALAFYYKVLDLAPDNKPAKDAVLRLEDR
jgi:tetratricopeptide (TPR) repeat protein